MDSKKFGPKILLLANLLLIALLGLVSSYKLPNFSDANWDTALFLTPLGIIKNFLDSDSVLKTFYFDASRGNAYLNHYRSTQIFAIWYTEIALLIFWLRRKKIA